MSEDVNDNKSESLIQAFEILTKFIGTIPQSLLSTPQGAGLFSILVGIFMKQHGIGERRVELRFISSASQKQKDIWISEYGSEENACKVNIGKSPSICEEIEISPAMSIDVFPFEIPKIVGSEFGNMKVSDIVITGGFMSLTSEFWKGIGEIVPL